MSDSSTCRRKANIDLPIYIYIRELVAPLLARHAAYIAKALGPVLRMSDDDRVTARENVLRGAHSTHLNEEDLPQFQQDPRHLAFCHQYFSEEAAT